MTSLEPLHRRDRSKHDGSQAASHGSLKRAARMLVSAAIALASLAACSGQRAGQQASGDTTDYARKQPDATVQMSQIHAAFIGSGSAGHGQLFYRGRVYPFTVGGLGVGGIGASTVEASGNVYNLSNITQFSGTYAQGRYGLAAGTLSTGDLWLQNSSGVVLDLKAKRTGLILSLGGDAVVISMNTPAAVSAK